MDIEHAAALIPWIPLLPLLAAASSGVWLLLTRRAWPSTIVWLVHCAAPLLAFAISVLATWVLATGFEPDERFLTANLYTWISAGDFHAELALLLDPLSAVMALLVSGVGSLIHIHAAGRMRVDERPDRGYQRSGVYLNLLLGAMLVLVLGDNLVLLFLGWQGVGVASYLLIGFWYLDGRAAHAAQRAFVVHRIGDLGLLLGICLLFWAYSEIGQPTLAFRTMLEHAPALAGARVDVPWWLGLAGLDVPTWSLASLAGLLLLLGACAKSAQLPLHVWLPDSVAAPAPASALIQAAATATAGVYLIARMAFLYEMAPGAQATLIWIGIGTAFLGASIALAQRDIERVLAWSTVSQLGFVWVAVGVTSYTAALFHLISHAFFKALLVLAAGSVVVALGRERRLERMGGLRGPMPWTHATFLIGAWALAGLPPTSGFFSRDEILGGLFRAELYGAEWVFALGVVAAAMTSFYAARLYLLVFDGPSRASYSVGRGVREQNASMVFPLVVLSGFAVLGGIFGLPDTWGAWIFGVERSNSLHYFLVPVTGEADPEPADLVALAASLAAAFGGVAVAVALYRRHLRLSRRWLFRLVPLQRALVEGLWIDALYERSLVRPLRGLSHGLVARTLDARWIDAGLFGGAARAVHALADRWIKRSQTGLVQSYVFAMLVGVLALLAWLIGGA